MARIRGVFSRGIDRVASAILTMLFAATLAIVGAAPSLALGEAEEVANEKPRVAFIIGNDEYQNINKLRNPVNDGKLIADTLKRLNFVVIEGYDLTLAQTFALFNDNKPLVDKAEAVVVYYAGHGFQFGKKNYLVPVDADFTNRENVGSETIAVDGLIELLQDEGRPLFLFLDACSNNPLAIDDQQDGLAQIQSGLNFFAAFATMPGFTTKDGTGNNSPFAKALAHNLEVPGLSILNLDIRVREETRALTINQQTPWSQQSLLTDFFFSERQTLNPNAILLAANTIMTRGDETQRDVFQSDLEELGLQGAVMRAQQREVVLQGLDLYTAPPRPSGTTVASADPEATLELSSATAPMGTGSAVPGEPAVAGETIPATIGTLLFASRGTAGEVPIDAARQIERATLARQLQTELRRLGCYNMAVDGEWGRGSRTALKAYFDAKRLPGDDLDPSVATLDRALLESGRICRAPVRVRPADRTPTIAGPRSDRNIRVSRRSTEEDEGASRGKRRQQWQMRSTQSFRAAPARGQSAPARQARAEQRQEIRRQMGVGIGMGF